MSIPQEMDHRLSDMSIYWLNGLREGDEHPTYVQQRRHQDTLSGEGAMVQDV